MPLGSAPLGGKCKPVACWTPKTWLTWTSSFAVALLCVHLWTPCPALSRTLSSPACQCTTLTRTPTFLEWDQLTVPTDSRRRSQHLMPTWIFWYFGISKRRVLFGAVLRNPMQNGPGDERKSESYLKSGLLTPPLINSKTSLAAA